jgi:hypothetical protein
LASPTPKTIPIRVAGLALFYANLARALTDAGITGRRLNEILASHLRVSCARCDIHLTTEEIEQVSLVEETTQLSHPKLKRLRLGYCARAGCESDNYQIQLEAYPGVDWETVVAKANDLVSAQKAAEKAAVQRQARQKQTQRTKRAMLALLAVAACFLLLFVWRHGRLPFVKKPHKYQIDPASVSPGPRR